MVLRLTLIAHAATEATHAGRFARPDDELSRAGTGAAERLASGGLVPPSPELLVRAPEVRVAQTASILGYGHARVDHALEDLDLGAWSGTGLDSIPGEELAAWTSDPAFDAHGGESVAAACARVGAALDGLPAEGTAVVLAHPSTLRAAVIHCLSAGPAAFFRVDAGPGHTLGLHRRGDRWTLRL